MAPPETTPSAEPTLTELLALVDALRAEVAQLRAENQVLKDEIARLKGLPPRPPFKPSGMDKATPPAGKRRAKRGRGVKRLAATEEQVVPASEPVGSRFKGYEDVVVQDLAWSVRVIRYRRERWLTPDGATVIAPLPAGVVGGFGPGAAALSPGRPHRRPGHERAADRAAHRTRKSLAVFRLPWLVGETLRI